MEILSIETSDGVMRFQPTLAGGIEIISGNSQKIVKEVHLRVDSTLDAESICDFLASQSAPVIPKKEIAKVVEYLKTFIQ